MLLPLRSLTLDHRALSIESAVTICDYCYEML